MDALPAHAVDVEYRTTRIILLVLTIIHRRFQLATGQRDQRIDESPQFRGQRRIVQFQSKRDRPRHAAKDHVELLSGGVGEQFAGFLTAFAAASALRLVAGAGVGVGAVASNEAASVFVVDCS